MRNDPTVVALVLRARAGDKAAWDDIVDRYAPLVWAICRRFHLSDADTDDVGQTIWVRLIEHIQVLREPAALPGWIATTARRECLRLVQEAGRRQARESSGAFETVPTEESEEVDHALLADELDIALRAAFDELPSHCQQLLSLLFHDPPLPYADIARRLDMKVGSIGPTRKRCLEKVRECPALAALLDSTAQPVRGGADRG
jgi:RNA polymerase sigma factor (sigma-70 family)